MTALYGWENFYQIAGSSAGALIGLQFVILALMADSPAARADPRAGNAFGTPTVVHFGVVLLLSAVACAPWHEITAVAVLWCLAGLGGMGYIVVVARRMRLQAAYRPVLEDWLYYVLFPFVAYAVLVGAACAAYSYPRPAQFIVGAAVLVLLFMGIHNAWDTVMYHVFVQRREQRDAEQQR
jgi:hypothetical protein